MNWRTEAACKDYDLDTFYPNSRDPLAYAYARGICRRCPVVTECLEAAMVEEAGTQRHGIRGGMGADERLALARRRTRLAARA